MSEQFTLYLETTIPSFLTARPSNNLVVRALSVAAAEAGHILPVICTPDELFGGDDE